MASKAPQKPRMRLKDYPEAIAFYDKLREQRPLEKHEWERQRELKRAYQQALGQARYRAKNRETLLVRNQEWRRKNKKRILREAKKAYWDNPGWYAAKARKYRKTHPEKAAEYNLKKLARRRQKLIEAGKLLLLPHPDAFK